jgi:predicted  nucleic acid-binding Zn-ribbon protein
VDSGYAALLQKQAELTSRQSDLEREKRAVEKEIAADTSREVRPEIAALLGDEPGSKSLNRRRVAEIRSEIADIEQAVIVLRQRLADARGRASTAVVAASRMEYARRVKAMVAAMQTLDAAHRAYDELRFQFEAEDIAWTSLIPMTPTFLGGSNEPDRRIARFIREAEAAGYGD